MEYGFAINLMHHLVVPTFVIDANCRVIIWNRACEALTGVAAEEVLGTDQHWRAFYRDLRPCLADLVAQGRTGEIDTCYLSNEALDGGIQGFHAENWCVMPRLDTELYLAIDAGPIYDEKGQLVAVVESLRNMTEQKRATLALEQLAATDALTGVANRRTFDERLDQECRRAKREATFLGLVLLDVDHFKLYNDTFGHPQGDECLRRVARVLLERKSRAGDTVARYGGEEFALILPGVDLAGANTVAEAVRANVFELAIPAPGGPRARVTVSLGVSAIEPRTEAGSAELIARADQALYAAKSKGRNRVGA